MKFVSPVSSPLTVPTDIGEDPFMSTPTNSLQNTPTHRRALVATLDGSDGPRNQAPTPTVSEQRVRVIQAALDASPALAAEMVHLQQCLSDEIHAHEEAKQDVASERSARLHAEEMLAAERTTHQAAQHDLALQMIASGRAQEEVDRLQAELAQSKASLSTTHAELLQARIHLTTARDERDTAKASFNREQSQRLFATRAFERERALRDAAEIADNLSSEGETTLSHMSLPRRPVQKTSKGPAPKSKTMTRRQVMKQRAEEASASGADDTKASGWDFRAWPPQDTVGKSNAAFDNIHLLPFAKPKPNVAATSSISAPLMRLRQRKTSTHSAIPNRPMALPGSGTQGSPFLVSPAPPSAPTVTAEMRSTASNGTVKSQSSESYDASVSSTTKATGSCAVKAKGRAVRGTEINQTTGSKQATGGNQRTKKGPRFVSPLAVSSSSVSRTFPTSNASASNSQAMDVIDLSMEPESEEETDHLQAGRPVTPSQTLKRDQRQAAVTPTHRRRQRPRRSGGNDPDGAATPGLDAGSVGLIFALSNTAPAPIAPNVLAPAVLNAAITANSATTSTSTNTVTSDSNTVTSVNNATLAPAANTVTSVNNASIPDVVNPSTTNVAAPNNDDEEFKDVYALFTDEALLGVKM